MLAFHYCDKMSEESDLKEERFIWRTVSEIADHVPLVPLLRPCDAAEEHHSRARGKRTAHLMVARKKRANVCQWASFFFCLYSTWAPRTVDGATHTQGKSALSICCTTYQSFPETPSQTHSVVFFTNLIGISCSSQVDNQH